MTQNKKQEQVNNTNNPRTGLKYLLVLAGLLSIFWGIGIEDDRDKMTPEQAQSELPRPGASAGLVGAGVACWAGAYLLSRKNNGR